MKGSVVLLRAVRALKSLLTFWVRRWLFHWDFGTLRKPSVSSILSNKRHRPMCLWYGQGRSHSEANEKNILGVPTDFPLMSYLRVSVMKSSVRVPLVSAGPKNKVKKQSRHQMTARSKRYTVIFFLFLFEINCASLFCILQDGVLLLVKIYKKDLRRRETFFSSVLQMWHQFSPSLYKWMGIKHSCKKQISFDVFNNHFVFFFI